MKFSSVRSVLSLAVAALAVASGAARAQEEEKVLNIYNWSDYIAEDTIKNFEKETGIKVRYDNFDNNEIVHAKLVAGKTGYDIVVPSSNWAKLQAEGGLLQKLDKSQLPNWKHLDPAVLNQLANLDPGNQYMVNWLWGYTTVGINIDKVKAALGGAPLPDNVWDLVFKPEYICRTCCPTPSSSRPQAGAFAACWNRWAARAVCSRCRTRGPACRRRSARPSSTASTRAARLRPASRAAPAWGWPS